VEACGPGSCRDKGRGGVDEGLVLVLVGVLHEVPTGSRCHQDKHQAPTLLHIRPLSLQDGDTRITPFGRQHSSGERVCTAGWFCDDGRINSV